MGFDTSGYVLKAARSAPSNAMGTAGASSGVLREHADLPSSYTLPGDLVEVAADQYRAAVLRSPAGGTQEYLFWAANSSNLAVVEDASWAISDGAGSIPAGKTTFTSHSVTYTDGTSRVIVVDGGGRSIAGVVSMVIVRGDELLTPITAAFASQDADAGVVELDDATLLLLGGALSRTRGDSISSVSYYLAAQKFWWTRNDPDVERFGWVGTTQRWAPYKGSPPVNLGEVLEGGSYTLLPRLTRFVVGDVLPGDPLELDAYAMVRVGEWPDSSSVPANVLVVSDDDASSSSYSFPVGIDAVVGVSSGVLQWNPTFVGSNVGRRAWYVHETFVPESDGIVGKLLGADEEPLFLCPVPAPGQSPFVRLGSRRHLRAIQADDDAALSVMVVSEGEVGWSASTGKLKLSSEDVAKANPDDAGFNILYLATNVVYDGVSFTRQPVGTRGPVQVVDSTGTPTTVDSSKDLFVPASVPLPSPGTSGIMLVPDGTGTTPAVGTARTRPNGTGLVRAVEVEGDLVVFSRSGCLAKVEVVEFEDDLPRFAFKVPKGQAYLSLEASATGAGSKLQLGLKDRRTFAGEALYLLQAVVQPASFASEARLVSRVREPFVVTGTEVLAFAIDGVGYLWSASLMGAGSYTASEVADSLETVVTGTGTVTSANGRILLSSANLATGSVEVGFGSDTSGDFVDRNLSGCAALGFLPGWRVDDPSSTDNWLPDAGLHLGVWRSPQNLDRSREQGDFVSRGRFDDAVLSQAVLASPVFLLNNPPYLDVAGYDVGVFFQTLDGAYRRSLAPFKDVLYQFEDRRFAWLEQGSITAAVTAATDTLPLGATGVVPDTLHPAVGDGYGLYLDEDGSGLVLQVRGEDYLSGGDDGTATLVEVVGGLVTSGARGSFSAAGTTFTDPDATFLADGVTVGHRLKLIGGPARAQGSYIVASVPSETEVEVEPSVPFLVEGTDVSWEVREAFTSDVFDPGLLADVTYDVFDHLAAEPFLVKVLSPLGDTPADDSDPRLRAVCSDAVAEGREMSIRFGREPGAEAEVTALGVTRLGVIVNGVLVVPDVTDPHFLTEAFSIRVGSAAYQTGMNLVGVSVFTDPLPGDQVEYGLPSTGIEGQLNFGTDTLDAMAGSLVYYAQEFSAPTDLDAGEAEIDPVTGDLNFSATDLSSYVGTEAWFVEQMITQGRLDVAIDPMQGAVFFRRPLREGVVVEVSYYKADAAGQLIYDGGSPVLVTEFLPLFVRLETATAVTTTEYSFNPTGRRVRADVEAQVWVDNRLQNYGNTTTCSVDATASTIRFVNAVASGAVVQVSYAVDETFGGEQGFTVSAPPVYRPPFLLLSGEDTFSLDTDRTTDVVPGKLLIVGGQPFYVASSTYDVGANVTTVSLFPTPSREAGSRSPGNDVQAFLTSVPVAVEVDGNPTGGAAGFLMTLDVAYEPVDAGMLSVVFFGDVTRFAVSGHLLEVGGYPLVVAGSELAEDGRTTRVDVTSPFIKGFDPATDAVRVSTRPAYPPQTRNLVGLGPIVPGEGLEVVLFGELAADGTPLPGRTLVLGQDFSFSADTGDVSLLAPLQAALAAGQVIRASFTRKRVLAPFVKEGLIVLPRYRAGYAHVTTPSEDNGLLGAYLVSTCVFPSPDSFYVRAVPLLDYMGEVAQLAVDRVASRTPHGGPVVVSGPPQTNWSFGTLPLRSQERELLDQDRAGRVFISLYDAFVRAFEQVLEAISGGVVGDRDGKFRFFVGRGRTYGGAGYEDEVTGRLEPRSVWSQVFEAANQNFGVTVDDPLVDPETATQDPLTLEVSGTAMDPWLLDFYVQQQRKYVLNDVDDLVLVRKRTEFTFPFSFRQVGVFGSMWEPSLLSRLYPEATLAFTTTYPGLLAGTLPDDPGVYAFLKLVGRPRLLGGEGPVYGSTFGQDVGSIENPVLGLIQNVTGQPKVQPRLARARVWAYSATGFPDVDPATDGKPSIIATVLPIREFPVSSTTGLPDTTQLAANGGPLPDLSTGDMDLSTPAWKAYSADDGIRPQVAFGRPAGDTYAVGYAAGTLTSAFGGAFTFDPTYKGIFVGGVYAGCVITFTSGDGEEITSADDIVIIGEDGVSTSTFAPKRGDTIYVIPPGSDDASSFSDPPSLKDLRKLAEQQPSLDVGIRERRSAFVDRSLPSARDPSPFPIKEIVGQRSAEPLQAIEASVEFVNTRRAPLEFPALQGLQTNDSGDHAIPYLSTTNTELDRLASAQAALTATVQTDSPAPGAVYPDEVVGSDGSILDAASGATPPATILTSRDLTPVTTAGSYTAHSGVADVRRYDVLLVERGQASVADGIEGILSVGEVTTSTIETPRFVTASLAGTRIRYQFASVMVHLSTTGLSGVVVEEVAGTTTTFDISTVGGLFLNDGSGTATGGLNNVVDNGLFPYPNGNLVTIDIIDQGTGLVVETILLDGVNVTGGLGTVAMAAVPTFNDSLLTVSAVGFVDFATLGGAAPGPVGPFDFRVSVDTFVAILTAATGTDTGYVDDDRLTFVEAIDFRTVLPRGSVTVGGVSVQGELSVQRVTASGTQCSVNRPAVVNGGDPFTFLARDSGSPTSIGSFDPSPGSGLGTVKVMGVEGFNDTTLPSTGSFTFSAVPSSDQDEDGDILSGTGATYDTGVAGINPASLVGVAATTGALANVVPGDVVIIRTSSVGDATTKAGTYLVRHAVTESPAASGYHEMFMSAAGGAGSGWVRSPFPTVLSASAGAVTVTAVQTVTLSPSGFDWDTTGRLYLFVDPADLTATISREYTAFVVNGDDTVTFTLDTTGTTGADAIGAAVTDGEFDDAAAEATGKPVSGMVFLPLHFPAPLPSNNVVGHGHGVTTVGGFVDVTLSGVGGSYTFTFGTDLVDATGVTPAADEVGLAVSDVTTTDSTVFLTDTSTPVYLDVPLYADLRGLADGASSIYTAIHDAGASAVRCVSPGDVLRSDDGSSGVGTGFHATAGVFLEPSWPRPVRDLSDGFPKVVDAATSAPSSQEVGMRSASFFGVSSPEAVAFEVRRIRRFHDVLDGIGDNLAPLRFAYEVRSGTVSSYDVGTRLLVASPDPTTGGGTQLGGFDDLDVNVNPGDEVRILDAGGNVVDRAEVAAVVDSLILWLRAPGLAESPPAGGETFQVYLRQAPVPHVQSNEQLLGLIVEQALLSSAADPTTGDGGRVDVTNFLKDPSVGDFTTLGLQEGDILLVDPAGTLSGATGEAVPPEVGARPRGDQSVSTRTDGSHITGGPSDLDDNRGWYRVVSVSSDTVEVTGVTDWTGADGAPVILGSDSPTNQQFVVYPDITASGLTGSTEGQMDLRRTKPALVSNSYQDGSYKSVEPFSYRIFRPTSLVSEQTVDLILMLRERMLSLVEKLAPALNSDKQGSYYVFQRDEHVTDVGSATDGDDGLGVPSNAFVTGLTGLTQYAPFANTSDGLSVLDRRYWVLDTRLDSEVPPYAASSPDPYSSFDADNSLSGYTIGSGRPVEPDLVEEVLDRSDRIRALRYSWVKFRTNLDDGTLPSVARFVAELPRLLAEQEDLLRLQQSIDGTG